MEEENLRWDCSKDGCYRNLCLPKWHVFNEALDGCRLTDIDGLCERRGRFLVVEWKPPGRRVERAQELALQRLSRLHEVTALIVHGLTDPMEPKYIREPFGKDEVTSLADMQKRLARWRAD